MGLKVINGDITEVTNGYIIHQVNDKGVMGAGVALAIKNKFPAHYEDYKATQKLVGLILGDLINTNVSKDLNIIGFISQCGLKSIFNRKPTNYDAFYNCLLQLKEIYENDSDSEFYMPLYIGCCNGGGDWETISKMIEEICPFIILVNYDKRA